VGRHGRVARLDDGIERALLVRGVALDGLDQVRDQVVALLELNIDVGEGLVRALAQRNKAVVDRNDPDHEQDDNP
jgi:hypothetical protein